MPRLDTNRAAEMEVFVRVVSLGGFTAAAREFRLTPSGVSKLVSRLEARLGSRLVNRSTRKLQLTPEGEAFYQRATRVLSDMEEAEREASVSASPRGHLRVNTNIPVGMRLIVPLIPIFLEQNPEVTLDVVLTDAVVDLMQERADVAIRFGPLRDSRLVARKLGSTRMSVVASPEYLARRGTPAVPADLARHRGIGWTFSRTISGWPFRTGANASAGADIGPGAESAILLIAAPPVVRASDGEAARQLALGGAGIARLSRFHVGADVSAGRLVAVLEDFNPGDREDIHAVFLGRGGPLPARVRAFVDFLAERVRIDG
jgi:DNA-binding transcriptional LysR family regulator